MQRLNERYSDFFARRHELQVYESKREAAGVEVTRVNTQEERAKKAEAQAYARRPKPPADTGPALRAWDVDNGKWARQREEARREYVEVQNHVRRMEKTAKKIPENLEYDLQN